MTHSEVEKAIPSFLDDKLDAIELDDFLEHIDECDNCKEELTIQFIVRTGVSRLEKGDAFNLQGELDAKLRIAHEKLLVLKRLVCFSWILQSIVFLEALILMLLTIKIWTI